MGIDIGISRATLTQLMVHVKMFVNASLTSFKPTEFLQA